MTRDELLFSICPMDRIFGCCNEYTKEYCNDCKRIMNGWLDEYDNHVIEQYNADTNLKDTIREIHDNVANEMYCKGIDDFMKALITMYERYDIDAVFESSDTYSYTNACYIFEHYIKEIAKELKEGKSLRLNDAIEIVKAGVNNE